MLVLNYAWMFATLKTTTGDRIWSRNTGLVDSVEMCFRFYMPS